MTDEVKQIAEELESAENGVNQPAEQVEENQVSEELESAAESVEMPDENKPLNELPLPDEEKDYEKKWPKGFKERLQRQNTQLKKEQQEKDHLRGELAKYHSMMQASQAVSESLEEGSPKRENFSTDDAYTDALVEYKFKKKAHKEQQDKMAMNIQAYHEQLSKRADEADRLGEKKYSDYSEVVQNLYDPSFPANRPMYEAILDSDHKEDLLYFLGKYKDKARDIALMPPARAIKKIAEIESRFEARKKDNKSKAPAPLTEVKGGAVSMTTKDPNKMSPSEYREWRQQGKK